MTTGGIVFMLVCWSAIITLAAFCFYKMFKSGREDAMGPRDMLG